MEINLGIVWQIALLVLGGLVTWAVQRVFDRQARLVTYYGHTSIHHVSTDKPITVHTHSLVIRNTGRAAATNVRVSHRINPLNVYVDPPCNYRREPVPNSGDDIVFDTLVPGQLLAISYLYYPPVIFSQFGHAVRSDQGFAKPVSVIAQQQVGRRTSVFLGILVIVGAITTLYFAWYGGMILARQLALV